jgi:RNA polymerase sigma factor (sigma-70 family)
MNTNGPPSHRGNWKPERARRAFRAYAQQQPYEQVDDSTVFNCSNLSDVITEPPDYFCDEPIMANIKLLRKALKMLPERERMIVEMRRGLNGYNKAHTLKEIADDIGRTKERVRQIEERAHNHIKDFFRAEIGGPPQI